MDRLCAAGGVRATPGAEELRTFVENLAPLDGLEVGRLLAAKMVRPTGLQCWRLSKHTDRGKQRVGTDSAVAAAAAGAAGEEGVPTSIAVFYCDMWFIGCARRRARRGRRRCARCARWRLSCSRAPPPHVARPQSTSRCANEDLFEQSRPEACCCAGAGAFVCQRPILCASVPSACSRIELSVSKADAAARCLSHVDLAHVAPTKNQ